MKTDIGEIEALAQAYYDALDVVEKEADDLRMEIPRYVTA